MGHQTVNRIQQVLLATMLEKPYPTIVMSELIERSGLGRATFYRHFKDIHAIASSISDMIAADVNQALQASEAKLGEQATPLDIIVETLPAIYAHRDMLRVLWGPNGVGNVAVRLHQHYYPWMKDHYLRRPHKHGIQEDYVIDYLTATMVSMIIMWMSRPLPEHPELFGKILRDIAANPTSDLLAQ
jgi:AcrR family transcriptional regulator